MVDSALSVRANYVQGHPKLGRRGQTGHDALYDDIVKLVKNYYDPPPSVRSTRGFYGNTYTSVSSGLTFVTGKAGRA